jgi:hypothetical protein
MQHTYGGNRKSIQNFSNQENEKGCLAHIGSMKNTVRELEVRVHLALSPEEHHKRD